MTNVFYEPIYLFGRKTKYIVSTDGEVFNTETGKALQPEITTRGYQRVLIYYKGKRKHYAVHRLVAEAFLPNPHFLPEVNHKNGDKTDNTVYNLEWCTPEYNVRHSYETGLNYSGEDKGNASMSNNTAKRIANCFFENKLTPTEIANLTNVSKRAVKHILLDHQWERVIGKCDFSNYDILDFRYNRRMDGHEYCLNDHDRRILRGCELMATSDYSTEDIAKIIALPEDEVQELCSAEDWEPHKFRTGTMIVRKVNGRVPLKQNR